MRGPWEGDWPVSAAWRYSSGNPHFALDIAMPNGTELYAPGDGVIVDCCTGVKGNGYGIVGAASNWLIIKFEAPAGPHKGQMLHGYMQHLDKCTVRKGQKVKQGDLLGLSDNTGNSSGPHLHFVILKPGHTMTAATRYLYLAHPDWVAWPMQATWRDERYGPIEVYLEKLRPGVRDSASVAFYRKCLINRDTLVPAPGLSVDHPGNDWTKSVTEATKVWERRHGHKPDGILTKAQAREFFARNTHVVLVG